MPPARPRAINSDVATDSGFTALVAGYNSLDVGNVLATSVTGLMANTVYFYRLRAYNGGGAAAAILTTITVKTLAAGTPKVITVTLPGEGSANTPALSLGWGTARHHARHHAHSHDRWHDGEYRLCRHQEHYFQRTDRQPQLSGDCHFHRRCGHGKHYAHQGGVTDDHRLGRDDRGQGKFELQRPPRCDGSLPGESRRRRRLSAYRSTSR